MDVVDILKARINSLSEGPYLSGLRAVLLHIEVAARHFARGQKDSDETAFTDAIYRSNQAFEGSLKEAYRVLAEREPAKIRPFEIEQHFQEQGSLRPRVLEQLATYRTKWRNPSTHDYRLDFDEDEALLAIVTVCVFAIVLIDQISERISYKQAQEIASRAKVRTRTRQKLIRRVASLIQDFTVEFNKDKAKRFNVRETELAGALSGFFSSAAPEITAEVEPRLSPDGAHGPDILVSRGHDRLILEIKRTKPTDANVRTGIEQVSYYMAATGIKEAVIYFYYSRNRGHILIQEHPLPALDGLILVVATAPTD